MSTYEEGRREAAEEIAQAIAKASALKEGCQCEECSIAARHVAIARAVAQGAQ